MNGRTARGKRRYGGASTVLSHSVLLLTVVGQMGCGRLGFEQSPDAASIDASANAKRSFLISSNTNNTVTVLAIDPATGELAATSQGDVPVLSPNVIGTTPDGRFIYVPSYNDARLYGFALDAQTGILSPIPGMPIVHPAGLRGQSVRVHPSGAYLYEVNDGLASGVTTYAIDRNTGALTARATVNTGGAGAYFATINPSGTLMYVSSYTPTMAGYAISPVDGALSMLPAFPISVQPANLNVEFDASGRYLYHIANGTEVRAYEVDNSSGRLTQLSQSPFPIVAGFIDLKFDPSQRFLLSVTVNTSGTYVWARDQATGELSLTVQSPYRAPAMPEAEDRGATAFSPDGRYFYAGSSYLAAAPTLTTFGFDATTGSLTVVRTQPRNSGFTSMLQITPQ